MLHSQNLHRIFFARWIGRQVIKSLYKEIPLKALHEVFNTDIQGSLKAEELSDLEERFWNFSS